MLNGMKGFALGATLAAAVLVMLPGAAERKLRRNTKTVRKYGTEAISKLSDMF